MNFKENPEPEPNFDTDTYFISSKVWIDIIKESKDAFERELALHCVDCEKCQRGFWFISDKKLCVEGNKRLALLRTKYILSH